MGVQFILQAWCNQYVGLLQISRLIFIYKALGECVKLIFRWRNFFSPKDCNFSCKMHFDQKYFKKIF